MRNSSKDGKRRDLRKATMKHQSFTAYNLYDKVHPEPPYFLKDEKWWEKNPDWNHWNSGRDQWVYNNYGICYEQCSGGPIPAEFRRGQNRLQRRREKAALCKTFLTGEWENLILPGYRNNIRWLYW